MTVDTIIMTGLFITWLAMYYQVEKRWRTHNKWILSLGLSVYVVSTYLIGYNLIQKFHLFT